MPVVLNCISATKQLNFQGHWLQATDKLCLAKELKIGFTLYTTNVLFVYTWNRRLKPNTNFF